MDSKLWKLWKKGSLTALSSLGFLFIFHISPTGHLRGPQPGSTNMCRSKNRQTNKQKPLFSLVKRPGKRQRIRDLAGRNIPPSPPRAQRVQLTTAAELGQRLIPCPQTWGSDRPGQSSSRNRQGTHILSHIQDIAAQSTPAAESTDTSLPHIWSISRPDM